MWELILVYARYEIYQDEVYHVVWFTDFGVFDK